MADFSCFFFGLFFFFLLLRSNIITTLQFIWPDIEQSSNEFIEWQGKIESMVFNFDEIAAAYQAMVDARDERQSKLGPKVHIQEFDQRKF